MTSHLLLSRIRFSGGCSFASTAVYFDFRPGRLSLYEYAYFDVLLDGVAAIDKDNKPARRNA